MRRKENVQIYIRVSKKCLGKLTIAYEKEQIKSWFEKKGKSNRIHTPNIRTKLECVQDAIFDESHHLSRLHVVWVLQH